MCMTNFSLKKFSSNDFQFWNDISYAVEREEFNQVAEKILDLEKQDKAYTFWLWDDLNNRPVAFVQLFNVLRFPALSANIEISVAEKFQRQGLGKKAILLLEKFAFVELGLLKLIAPISPENTPSMKLFTALGYSKLCEDPYAFFIDGKPMLHSIYVKLSPRVK